ncbi:PAS domain-containing protein [Helicobacter bilis]|nr:PAS domain-containing protein [Helicobacter bilis]TLE04669.1 PAS domain-containing protein [Helicobacter bilis]
MQELILDKDVLITSKTDLKGNVLYCNKPFLDYAEYDEEEVLFKSHNIVRHEDMPKCVFKILWEHIKQGQEAFAFVKNKTKYNNFYWVFANVTPNYNQHNQIIGYYSVRRKANEAAIAVIDKIYKQTLQIEKTQGVNKSYNFILEYAKNANLTYNNLVLNLQRNGHVA